MKRRSFVTQSTIAVAGATAVTSIACQPAAPNKLNPEDKVQQADEFDLSEMTIPELQQRMQSGQLSAVSITQKYLDRIAALDKAEDGKGVNAIIELNPDALSIARKMDDERKSGHVRGQMHGIPVLLKDNIDTGDKMMTTAGSAALAGHIAAEDAFIVKKLRDAGAVILGKTNLSEWANFRSSKSCSGWSSRGGQTRNPYYTDRNPCGSSSGSGVAVSANFCAVAIGTETDGSITCPASTNGVVGIKPTVGFCSRSGIIPISYTQDTAGPLTRTVTDAAILLNAIAGMDDQDEKTKTSREKTQRDYTINLKTDGLKGKRIGVEARKYENQFLTKLQQDIVDLIKQQGAEVIEISYLEKINELGDDEFELLKFEFKDGLNKYLSASNASVKSLKEVIEFNAANEDTVMPTFRQDILEESEKKDGLGSKAYLDLLEKVNIGSQKLIDQVMEQHQLDALAGLTMGPACAVDTIYGDRWGDVFLTSPAAMSGYPHISVPGGYVYDLPVGFSFFGKAWSEGKLIAMAYAFEQASKNRRKPEFKSRF